MSWITTEKLDKIEWKTPTMVSFNRKVALMAWPVTLLKKEVIVDVILLILHFFKNTLSKESLQATASGIWIDNDDEHRGTP